MSIDDATFKHVLPDACLEQETEHNLAYVRLAAKSQNPMSKFATGEQEAAEPSRAHHPPIWCHCVDRRERGPRDG